MPSLLSLLSSIKGALFFQRFVTRFCKMSRFQQFDRHVLYQWVGFRTLLLFNTCHTCFRKYYHRCWAMTYNTLQHSKSICISKSILCSQRNSRIFLIHYLIVNWSLLTLLLVKTCLIVGHKVTFLSTLYVIISLTVTILHWMKTSAIVALTSQRHRILCLASTYLKTSLHSCLLALPCTKRV